MTKVLIANRAGNDKLDLGLSENLFYPQMLHLNNDLSSGKSENDHE